MLKMPEYGDLGLKMTHPAPCTRYKKAVKVITLRLFLEKQF